MKDLIRKLVETTGPSGFEAEIRDLVQAEIDPLVSEARVDALGNLIARKGEKAADGLRIMLSAHLDEIGVIATHIDEMGFIRFTNIGGVHASTCIGGRVRFVGGARGVIQAERLDPPDKIPSLDKLYIDVGATSREDCPVKVGDVAGFERPFLDLGDRLVAKSMDDRIAVAVLVEVIRQLKDTPHELFFVFSVQEEVGTRGAITAAFGLDPDLGLAVDVTLTGDTPKSRFMEVCLGKGPAIKVRDSGMLADPRLVDCMVQIAGRLQIPYQMEVLDGGSTDARSIQVSRAGVPAGCLSIPCRYVHSPSEMVDYRDVQNAVRFLVEFLGGPIHLA
ncbi:MAG TPA: M42 family metallopeptidase [Anaerolineaceae bacterium]|nr:M42 family metallopeptidase [Anaerolineaceae bacterium]